MDHGTRNTEYGGYGVDLRSESGLRAPGSVCSREVPEAVTLSADTMLPAWPEPQRSATVATGTARAADARGRLELRQDDVKNGLGQLVLTVVKLLHELLERQAVRRIEAGGLTDAEVERLGTTLMRQAEEIDRLRREFNLEEEDLNLDLGPLGRLM